MNRPTDNGEREGNPMTDTILISLDDLVLFRLRDGRRPLVCPDSVTRVAYETGINVLHTGVVWAVGYADGVEAFELDDGTIVTIEDVDEDSLVVTPSEPT